MPQTESVKQSFHCEAARFSVVVWLVGLHSEEGNQLIGQACIRCCGLWPYRQHVRYLSLEDCLPAELIAENE